MKNVIIIGKGPAGISAALYTKRAGIETTIIGKDIGALKKAHSIENYYGFASPISGEELVENGIKNAERLGCEIISDEVLAITFNEKLTVITTEKEYTGDAIILATGASRNTPKIDNITEFEGKGVSYCAICDAFFYRGKDVCVLGNGKYALHEAEVLARVAKSVTILLDGENAQTEFPPNYKIFSQKVKSISGEKLIEKIIFSDDSECITNGLFIAMGTASSVDLARKLGVAISNNSIIVDKNMATNIPSLFACGDCVGGLLQIAKAVSDGAIAGLSAIKYINK